MLHLPDASAVAPQIPFHSPPAPPAANALETGDGHAARAAFDKFVGGTIFQQMLSSLQKTVDKPAYFHGGRAEEMFRSELNQVLAEKMADASAGQFTGPMFELFSLNRA